MSYFLTTYSGSELWYSDMKFDINLHDAARGLSNMCRWAGQLPDDKWWSVAQHSLVMHDLSVVSKHNKPSQRAHLLHDLPEYIVMDIPRPILESFPDLKSYKRSVEVVVMNRYDYDDSLVHYYDDQMLRVEAQYFELPSRNKLSPPVTLDSLKGSMHKYAVERIQYYESLSRREIRDMFLKRCWDLGIQDPQ